MAAPLCRMPPLAAAAADVELFGVLGPKPVTLSATASNRYYSGMRLHGDLVVFHWRHPVGPLLSPEGDLLLDSDGEPLEKPGFLHQEPSRSFDHVFPLLAGLNADDPRLCRDAIRDVLLRARTPLGFGAACWGSFGDESLAGQLATLVVDALGREGGAGEHHGVPRRFDISVHLTVRVAVVYNEPKTLLLACSKLVKDLPNDACSVCMDRFKLEKSVVSLICLHHFHHICILEWFDKKTTCPLCRKDMTQELTKVTKSQIGTTPGLGY